MPTAVKSALTRKYNQSHCAFKKTLSSAPSVSERFGEEGLDEDEGEEEEDVDQKLIKKKEPSKAGGKAKAGGGKAKAGGGKARK